MSKQALRFNLFDGLPGSFDGDFYDTLAREREIERHIEKVCDMDEVRGCTLPTAQERRLFAAAFRRFQEWAALCGVRALPATGHVAAFYLLDMLTAGEPLGDIECAADAIKFTHEMAEKWIDRAPIDAAVQIVREAYGKEGRS
jgi:hypothetical protein